MKHRTPWTSRLRAALAAVALLAGLVVAVPATPAAAVAGPEIVYVQERMDARWDAALREAVRLVDARTGSTMRWVTSCPAAADRCVKFVPRTMSRYHGLAVPYQADMDSAVIYLTPGYASNYPYRARVTLVAHELGHAMGLAHGTKGSIMFSMAAEQGLATRSFTAAERTFLSHR